MLVRSDTYVTNSRVFTTSETEDLEAVYEREDFDAGSITLFAAELAYAAEAAKLKGLADDDAIEYLVLSHEPATDIVEYILLARYKDEETYNLLSYCKFAEDPAKADKKLPDFDLLLKYGRELRVKESRREAERNAFWWGVCAVLFAVIGTNIFFHVDWKVLFFAVPLGAAVWYVLHRLLPRRAVATLDKPDKR